MSYDIELCDPITGKVLELDSPHQMRGGTYAIGGSITANLNITYNYAEYYYKYIDAEQGIRWIYGKTAAETLPKLIEASNQLKDDVSEDYWDPTEGNAKRAILQLLAFARIRPDGVWNGD